MIPIIPLVIYLCWTGRLQTDRRFVGITTESLRSPCSQWSSYILTYPSAISQTPPKVWDWGWPANAFRKLPEGYLALRHYQWELVFRSLSVKTYRICLSFCNLPVVKGSNVRIPCSSPGCLYTSTWQSSHPDRAIFSPCVTSSIVRTYLQRKQQQRKPKILL